MLYLQLLEGLVIQVSICIKPTYRPKTFARGARETTIEVEVALVYTSCPSLFSMASLSFEDPSTLTIGQASAVLLCDNLCIWAMDGQ